MEERKDNPANPAGESGQQMLKRMNKSHAPLRSWGLPHADWKPQMRILDVGCGGGATIRDMLDLSPDSRISGIDYSDVSVQSSRELLASFPETRVDIQKADVTAIPFPDNTFDLVTAVETIYFWPDPQKAAEEIRRVLKPYGELMILDEGSDPDHNDWPPVDGFMRIYRPEELTALLKNSRYHAVRYYRGQDQLICVLGRK